MMGDVVEDIAPGIDEMMIRQPLGVAGIISPFNFPAMIAFWFLPYAVATGNTVVVKPSSRVPITMVKLFRLMEEAGFPAGVVNMVHGGADIVNGMLDHPLIKSISFVGSTEVAKHVYSRGTANGKRVSAAGGAKNPVLILPDADVDTTTAIMMDSAFGCSGQRCLAASTAIMIGEADKIFIPKFAEAASKRVTGYGIKPEVQMGPVITPEDKIRIEGLINEGLKEGAEMLVDGRNAVIPGYEKGNFIKPTILVDTPVGGIIATTEVFGPVLGIMHCKTVEEAIKILNDGSMEIWVRYSPVTAQQRASSATKRMPAISASISAWLLRWRSSPSAAGRTAFLGICTDKENMPSNFSPRPRSSSSDGPGNGRGNSSSKGGAKERIHLSPLRNPATAWFRTSCRSIYERRIQLCPNKWLLLVRPAAS